MHTSELTKCLTSVVIFHYQLVSWRKFIHATGGPSDLSLGVYTVYQAIRSTHGQLKMTHINFATLNSHVTAVHLRFIESIYFYVVK